MYEPDFWTATAEAMELSIEGNRMIAREIADLIRNVWHRSFRSLDRVIRGLGHRRSDQIPL